jgi:hypothetical protein
VAGIEAGHHLFHGWKSRKEGNHMKRLILLGFFVIFFPAIVYAQDKVGVPIWNIGDKWKLTEDVTITVANADESSYAVKYLTAGGESILIFDKSSLNRLYVMDKDKRIPYEGRNKRLFNFPLEIGKSWKDKFVSKESLKEYTYFETFTALGWEDIVVQAGKFKTIKIEYKQSSSDEPAKEGKLWYWYSPDVKYMIKCQYEKSRYWDAIYDWELTSFELKK